LSQGRSKGAQLTGHRESQQRNKAFYQYNTSAPDPKKYQHPKIASLLFCVHFTTYYLISFRIALI